MTNAGTYYSPTPLDFVLLEKLPDKGILGGVHWAGRPVKHIRQEINEALPEGVPTLTADAIVARLRSMKIAGFTEDFAATGGRIWARTPQGLAHLGRKAELLGLPAETIGVAEPEGGEAGA